VSLCGALHRDKCRAVVAEHSVGVEHATCAFKAAWSVLEETRQLAPDERRGAMRALALAEILMLVDDLASGETASGVRQLWKDALLKAGVVDVITHLLDNPHHGHGDDLTEAAARLATVLEK
jgi:hypothetical protein